MIVLPADLSQGSRKSLNPVNTVVFIAIVALLALYALGVLDGGGDSQVDDIEYAAGEFVFSGGVSNDGHFSGYGSIDLENGSFLFGDFHEGRLTGNGAYSSGNGKSPDDWHFIGIFGNGQINSGTFRLSDGSRVFYSRDASIATLVGNTWQYNGQFNERGQNGTGSFTFQDGSVYTGSFSDGMANGEGLYKTADGKAIYVGGFVNGLFEGHGAYFSPEGWLYEGSFKDGLFDGEGRVTDKTSVIHGVWEKGEQITRYE